MITKTFKNFSLEEIAISGQCFRMQEIVCDDKMLDGLGDKSDHDTNARLSGNSATYQIIAGERVLIASQIGEKLSFDCTEREFKNYWHHYFDLDTDYGKIIDSIDPADEYLIRAAKSCPGVRILNQDLWEMILTYLVSQQNNIPRIKKCVEAMCKKYGKVIEGSVDRRCVADGRTSRFDKKTFDFENSIEPQPIYAIPTPASLACLGEDDLMELGLGYRSKYIVRTARDIDTGAFDLDALKGTDYETAREKLLTLYGVGKKVADCVCLFGLHHVEAFPIDTHIKQVLDKYYKKGFPFDRYEGYAGILQQYIFYYDLHGDK